jgi:hypothetical protein
MDMYEMQKLLDTYADAEAQLDALSEITEPRALELYRARIARDNPHARVVGTEYNRFAVVITVADCNHDPRHDWINLSAKLIAMDDEKWRAHVDAIAEECREKREAVAASVGASREEEERAEYERLREKYEAETTTE